MRQKLSTQEIQLLSAAGCLEKENRNERFAKDKTDKASSDNSHQYATKWYSYVMKRVFKTRHFTRWMRKTELTDAALCNAVEEMERGLIDADLGGNIVKKRIGMAGRGKSGSARTLVATKLESAWFFIYGFEKNDKANISDDDLEILKSFAKQLLARTSRQLENSVTGGTLQEIFHGEKAKG